MSAKTTYNILKDELQSWSKSVYIVNEKRPPSYDRAWKIYVLFKDGSNDTTWTADHPDALHQGMRDMIRVAQHRARDFGQATV